MAKNKPISPRQVARLFAAQALYEQTFTRHTAESMIAEYGARAPSPGMEEFKLPRADGALFIDLVRGVLRESGNIDRLLDVALKPKYELGRLDILLQVILRCGAYELAHRQDIPPRVTIDEYTGLSDSFFSAAETGIVNGVLDRLAHEVRPEEIGAPRGS
ncbi:MAG TPA: transcription antitermination factor NusB [Dongiaceae bacterium]|jgi:N utilization substance protein B|nr:transcription antitermination factor NusB [Dongiaceae bacterium]